MTWDEFTTLLSGLNGETPLGHIISIRSETNKDRIKQFTPAERKIRSDWQRRSAASCSTAETEKAIEGFHAMFKELSRKEG